MWKEAKAKKHTLLSTNVNKVMAGCTCQGHKVQFCMKYKTVQIQTTERLLSQIHMHKYTKKWEALSLKMFWLLFSKSN